MAHAHGGPVVLHVTEAFGAGVLSSLVQMARAFPRSTQHLLYRPRKGEDTGESANECFASVTPFQSLFKLSRTINRLVVELRIDIVHLHSSLAGAVGRIRPSGSVSIVYSPHGFLFESRDRHWVLRTVAWHVERHLARRSDLLICVSPYEQDRARELGARTAYVPNTVAPAPASTRRGPDLPWGSTGGRRTVVTAGRVCAAKDPRFLAEVVKALALLRGDTRWVWIGGGEPRFEQVLSGAGVQVTGWLPRTTVREWLERADLYVHTAAWDANPMTPLEAAAAGIPVIVRSIPSLVSLGHPGGLTHPREVAAVIDGHLSGEAPVRPPGLPSEADHRLALAAAYASLASRFRPSRTSMRP
jgi:glycosyltransferase involved in cell wall biosynthesis